MAERYWCVIKNGSRNYPLGARVRSKMRNDKERKWIMRKRTRVLHICMAFLLSLTTIFSCMMFPSAKAVWAASKPKVLIVYFGRYGNTDFREDVDATTSASIVLDGKKKRGTTETVARMIQKEILKDTSMPYGNCNLL